MSSIDSPSLASNTDATTSSSAKVDPGSLVYHVDLLLIAFLATFILFISPRALARLSTASEWTQGFVLRHIRYVRRKSRRNVIASPQWSDGTETTTASDDSHTLNSHTHLTQSRTQSQRYAYGQPSRYGSSEKGATSAYPTHIGSCFAFLRPVAVLLRRRLSPGFSIGQLLVLSVYFAILVYPSLYKSNPFTDPIRTGYVAMSQIPFVFIFAAKNNILGAFMGMGYAKLNFLHRFVGIVITLAANVHAIGYIYKWTLLGTFTSEIAQPAHAWGLVALICADSLYFFSTTYFRTNAYAFFFANHLISFSLFLPALWYHSSTMIPYIITALAIYGVDRIMRLIKTRLCVATLRPLPELGMTRVEVPSINAGWRAGQHVRLMVVSSGMGWLGWSEVHPFTIASVSGGEEGMVLMCKKAGDWTNKLHEIAKVGEYAEEKGREKIVKVVVEGPYGGPGHTIFSSYSAAVFVVGGSGITFALSTIQDLLQKDLDGTSRVKLIELIWMVQDPSSLTPLLPLFTTLIQQSSSSLTPLRISVHYTRSSSSPLPFKKSGQILPGLTLSVGRARIPKILDSVISRAVSLGSGPKDALHLTGVLVGVCGPVGLGDEVVKSVGAVDPLRRDQVGGLEIHEEEFGW